MSDLDPMAGELEVARAIMGDRVFVRYIRELQAQRMLEVLIDNAVSEALRREAFRRHGYQGDPGLVVS